MSLLGLPTRRAGKVDRTRLTEGIGKPASRDHGLVVLNTQALLPMMPCAPW